MKWLRHKVCLLFGHQWTVRAVMTTPDEKWFTWHCPCCQMISRLKEGEAIRNG